MSSQVAEFKNVANEKGEYALPKLSYGYDALEPVIDAQTVEIHYSKHHQTYVNNLNNAIKSHPELAKLSIEEILVDLNKVPEDIRTAVRNHGGGHANHSLYWSVLAPKGKNGTPSKALQAAIEKQFTSIDSFKEQITKASIGAFGSAWGWLSVKPDGELTIETTSNQDSPLSKGNVPIYVIDVWEHAYYLKYQNRRPDYAAAITDLINWEVVSLRYEQALKQVKG